MERVEYEMTEEDLDKILNACKPLLLIATHCGTPRSPIENANAAWRELGQRMGFDYTTAQPSGGGDRFFSAVPNDQVMRERNNQNMDGKTKGRV